LSVLRFHSVVTDMTVALQRRKILITVIGDSNRKGKLQHIALHMPPQLAMRHRQGRRLV